jgi:uncharacterized protein YndB with AHSA1/START domain
MNTSSARHPTLNGEVTFDGDFARLFYQRRLPHPPEKVWAAITDPAQLKQWFMARDVKFDGRPGGSVEMSAGPAQIHWQGRILTWDPPHVYEYEWIADPRPEFPKGENSVVRWELAPVDGATLLTLTHRHLSRPTAMGFGPGWHAFLDRLAAQIAGQSIPDWMERFTSVQSGYPGWEKGTRPKG